eukprot:675660_1
MIHKDSQCTEKQVKFEEISAYISCMDWIDAKEKQNAMNCFDDAMAQRIALERLQQEACNETNNKYLLFYFILMVLPCVITEVLILETEHGRLDHFTKNFGCKDINMYTVHIPPH